MDPGIVLVLCTVPDRSTAIRLADLVLGKRLGAGVSVVPGVESHYVWEGKREVAQELLLLIKTTRERWGVLEAELVQAHPYECPEVVMVEAAEVMERYASWVREGSRI
ncbi:MAG: divalent-cation tolerance protein CutA [Verrucomicrobiia bacterium]